MDKVFLGAAILLTLLIFFSLYRVVAGPTVLDRIVGITVLGAKTSVLLLLIGLLYHDVAMFVDIALAYALLNFLATLGATRFFERQRDVHLEENQAIEKENGK